jgi:hypothetical protein
MSKSTDIIDDLLDLRVDCLKRDRFFDHLVFGWQNLVSNLGLKKLFGVA